MNIEQSVSQLQDTHADVWETWLDAIFLISLEGIILHVNQSALTLLQAEHPQQLLGHPILDFVPVEEHTLANERRSRLRQGLPVHNILEGHFITCQGRRIKTIRTVAPGQFAGQPVLQIVVRDISEHEQTQLSLRQSEDKFAKVFRTNPDSITIAGMADGHILEVNEGFTRLTGYRAEEVVGKSAVGLGLWRFPEHRQHLLLRLRRGLPMRDIEVQICTRSGDLRSCSVSFEQIDFAGEDCLIAIARDITERVHIRQQLGERLAQEQLLSRISTLLAKTPSTRLKQAIDSALASIGQFMQVEHVWLIEFDFQSASRSMTHEWAAPGRAPVSPHFQNVSFDAYPWLIKHTLHGKHIVITDPQLLPPEAADVRAYLEKAEISTLLGITLFSAGQPYGVVGLFAAQSPTDGGEHWLQQLHLVAQVIANALIRKRDDAARRVSEERYALAAHGATDGIWDWDLKAGTLYLSSRLRDILCLHRQGEVVAQQTILDFIHPDDIASYQTTLKAHLKGRTTLFQVEFRVLDDAGQLRWVLSRGLGLRDHSERVYRMAGSVVDITVRKQTEEELSRHREQLEALVRERTQELADAQQELLRQERLAAIGQLTATVSHELRNPLGTISSSFAAVRGLVRFPDARMIRAFERIERNIQRCTNIIEQLLSYARSTAPARAPVNLDAWLRERVGEHVVPDDIRLQLELACGAIVAVDSQRLGQALDNVIVNACQAMQESQASQKIVRISSCSTGQNAEIQITDTGPGIPLDHQAKVFEPLFSTKSFGVGLGLPLVRQVLEQHGGDVILASEPGQGTCVTLRLPLG